MFPNSNPNQSEFQAYQQATNPQNKKVIIFGGLGGAILVIILAMLLFSGSGGNSAKLKNDLNNLLNNQSQITTIASQYRLNINSGDLLNDSAAAQIVWQSSLNDTSPFYNSLSKKPYTGTSVIDPKTKQTLDSAQQAGNLDSALATSLVNQANQIKNTLGAIEKDKPSPKLQTEINQINNLADYTIKQISPFTGTQ